MDDDDLVVGSEVHVELRAEAVLARTAEGGKRVLGNTDREVMETAVRVAVTADDLPPHVDGGVPPPRRDDEAGGSSSEGGGARDDARALEQLGIHGVSPHALVGVEGLQPALLDVRGIAMMHRLHGNETREHKHGRVDK